MVLRWGSPTRVHRSHSSTAFTCFFIAGSLCHQVLQRPDSEPVKGRFPVKFSCWCSTVLPVEPLFLIESFRSGVCPLTLVTRTQNL
ncbi:hypothetical protein ILYODFUR_024515 [Ilyodon furcidens]|uniref:Secreted protein n=1 Tax=Ilyodon furcidens TaxID=33524 RepID=A0ABV0U9U4_9TELE